MNAPIVIRGRGAFPGVAEAEALVGPMTVPGWDTFDLQTGEVLEKGNPLQGLSVTGRVLILNGSRGSTGWATQFLKIKVAGVGPAALVFPRTDSRIGAACVASRVPAVTDLQADIFALVQTGDRVRVDGDRGIVEIWRRTEIQYVIVRLTS